MKILLKSSLLTVNPVRPIGLTNRCLSALTYSMAPALLSKANNIRRKRVLKNSERIDQRNVFKKEATGRKYRSVRPVNGLVAEKTARLFCIRCFSLGENARIYNG